MALTINNIPVYDPTAPKSTKDINPTSTKDLSQNFLKMLTVQLQNQDPMNPLDNAAMTSQLAQLNMVDGINSLNKSISSMTQQMSAASFMNLSNSLGKVALVAGDTINHFGTPVSIAVETDAPAANALARIYSSQGNLVREMNLGAVDLGMNDFYWDGLTQSGLAAENGTYRLSIQAFGSDGSAISTKSYVGSFVTSIGMDGQSIRVGLSDGRNISSADITKWLA